MILGLSSDSLSLWIAGMIQLGVNIDHVATLRQARGTSYPSVLEAARVCQAAGAHGLTVHLREDRRHIQDQDVIDLSHAQILPLNLEMAAVDAIADIAVDLKPAEVCLVPEKREELTTEGGLDAAGLAPTLKPLIARLNEAGILVSLFIEADRRQIQAAAELEAPVIELHTGTYCEAPEDQRPQELSKLIDGAEYAHGFGLRVNAGHGITLEHMPDMISIPHLHTLNIGHSIISRSVFVGLHEAVREMLTAIGHS
jgi:pyridoxine 5-phosphate synthase